MKSVLKRLIFQYAFILLIVSFFSFLLTYLAPGDPAESLLNASGVPYTQELLEQTRQTLGIDKPFFVQYILWLLHLMQGQLGTSYQTGQPVLDMLFFYLPYTITLAFYALIATLLLSLPIAIYAAYYPKKWFTKTTLTAFSIFNAVPNFVLGLLLILFFSVSMRWLPVQSTGHALGLVLPTMTLCLIMASRYIPQMQTAFLEQLQSPAIQGARGRGIPEWNIFVFDILKNSLPFLISLVSMSLGSLLGGVTIIEYLFSWPGIGRMMITAVTNRDYPLIQGYVLWITSLFLLINLSTQIVTIFLTPKLRSSYQQGVHFHDGHIHVDKEADYLSQHEKAAELHYLEEVNAHDSTHSKP